MEFLNFNSVEDLPGLSARAIFKVNSSSVFKEDVNILQTIVDDKLSYIQWASIKQLIVIAKEAKLKNHAPIK